MEGELWNIGHHVFDSCSYGLEHLMASQNPSRTH